MAEKFIGDYINSLTAASDDEIKNGAVMVRTSTGDVKKAAGDKLGGGSFVAIYGQSTKSAISQAINEGRGVSCHDGNYFYTLADTSGNVVKFERSYKNSRGKVFKSYVQVDANDAWTRENIEMAKAEDITVPTKTSDLTNDSDFTTKAYVDGLVGDVEILLADL